MTKAAKVVLKQTDTHYLRGAADACFLAGFASILGSIGIWGFRRATANEGHAERFGIFVGLWAPTFFILSNRFERYADRLDDQQSSS